MKDKPTASLGKLGTQFFALVQIKEQEILYLGEIQQTLGISATHAISSVACYGTLTVLLHHLNPSYLIQFLGFSNKLIQHIKTGSITLYKF